MPSTTLPAPPLHNVSTQRPALTANQSTDDNADDNSSDDHDSQELEKKSDYFVCDAQRPRDV